MTATDLILYGRRFSCYDQARTMAFLDAHGIAYVFVDISADATAASRLQGWVGHLSVPTLLIGDGQTGLPTEPPAPLDPKRRVRGQDRGSMITEPSDSQLEQFLQRHGLMVSDR